MPRHALTISDLAGRVSESTRHLNPHLFGGPALGGAAAAVPQSPGAVNQRDPYTPAQLLALFNELKTVAAVVEQTGMARARVYLLLKRAGYRPEVRSWTADEDALLRDRCADGKTYSVTAIGAALHRSVCSVRLRICRLGLSCPRSQPRARITKPASQLELGTVGKEAFRNDTARRTKEWQGQHGHPKGMLGKKHTDAAKEAMSSARIGKSIPPDQVMRMLKTKHAEGTLITPRKGSWKSGWREIGDKRIFARSRWEANYARYLEWLKQQKQITEWEHEPETFWFEAIKRGCRSYTPDFRVQLLNGCVEFHEVKGWMDDRSRTKLKRMGIYHPNVRMVLIDKLWFRRNGKLMSRMLRGWESQCETPLTGHAATTNFVNDENKSCVRFITVRFLSARQ
jgi:hypothetical protein